MSNTMPDPAGMPGPVDLREIEIGRPAGRTGVRAVPGRAHTVVHSAHSAAGAPGRETAAARA